MYGMARLAEKLKIPNCINTKGNCVYYMYGFSRFAKKFNPDLRKFDRKLCILYVQIVWICRKIEYSK